MLEEQRLSERSLTRVVNGLLMVKSLLLLLSLALILWTTLYFLFDPHNFGTRSQAGPDGSVGRIGPRSHQLVIAVTPNQLVTVSLSGDKGLVFHLSSFMSASAAGLSEA